MSNAENTCIEPGCDRERYQDMEKCIFHVEKTTAKEKRELEQEEAAEYDDYIKLEKEFERNFFLLLKQMEMDNSLEYCDFSGFKFAEIDLSKEKLHNRLRRINFKKRMKFTTTTFVGKPDFSGIVFSQGADFDMAFFHEGCDFAGTSFVERANFYFASFQDRANFFKATFADGVEFGGAKFEKGAEFSKSIFKGKIHFEGSGNECLNRFWKIELDPGAKVVIENVNLKNASFAETNIEDFVFRNVDWYNHQDYYRDRREQSLLPNLFIRITIMFTRALILLFNLLFRPDIYRMHALRDEFHHGEFYLPEEDKVSVNYNTVADNYHQLVLNYEKKRDFETALDFRVGEMEVSRRTITNLIHKHLNLYILYKIFSFYGTSYWRAFGFLVFWVAFFAGIFLLSGFKPVPENKSDQVIPLNYDITLNCNRWVPFKQYSIDYFKTIRFALSILTFHKSSFFQPDGSSSQLCVCFAVIVFYSQVALLLLAIRRRFGR